eukprot:TRINITY_DN1333_c0_g2_i1.p1 TRINITY_DN1333_c0_g2~~TRINITY_DN1333_c0_g2_i1.p1  ORF type:complete len:1119 (-),score=213.14 TRINITY_DN1333_c0_g2_i1:99-3401(-)
MARDVYAHWGMFLPSHATPLSRVISGDEEPGGVLREGGLVAIMEQQSVASEVRCAAASTAAALISSAPLKLWMSSGSGLIGGAGLGGRTAAMLLYLQQKLLACLHSTVDSDVLVKLCHCVAALAATVPYAAMDGSNSTEPMLADTAAAALDATFTGLLHQLGELVAQHGLVQAGPPCATSSSSPSSAAATPQPPIAAARTAATGPLPAVPAVAVAACQAISAAFNREPPTAAADQFLSTFTTHTQRFTAEGLQEADGQPERFVACLLKLARRSKLRTEALLVLARIASTLPHHLLCSVGGGCDGSGNSGVRIALQLCFGDPDQNLRLHALKVMEELLRARTRPSTTIADSDSEWSTSLLGEIINRDLQRALQDPFHGVRAVACSCYALLLPSDWDGMPPQVRSKCLLLLTAATKDSATGVSAAACKVLGVVLSSDNDDDTSASQWRLDHAFTATCLAALAAVLSTGVSYQSVPGQRTSAPSPQPSRMQMSAAVAAVGQITRHFYLRFTAVEAQPFRYLSQANEHSTCSLPSAHVLLLLQQLLPTMTGADDLVPVATAVTAMGYLAALLTPEQCCMPPTCAMHPQPTDASVCVQQLTSGMCAALQGISHAGHASMPGGVSLADLTSMSTAISSLHTHLNDKERVSPPRRKARAAAADSTGWMMGACYCKALGALLTGAASAMWRGHYAQGQGALVCSAQGANSSCTWQDIWAMAWMALVSGADAAAAGLTCIPHTEHNPKGAALKDKLARVKAITHASRALYTFTWRLATLRDAPLMALSDGESMMTAFDSERLLTTSLRALQAAMAEAARTDRSSSSGSAGASNTIDDLVAAVAHLAVTALTVVTVSSHTVGKGVGVNSGALVDSAGALLALLSLPDDHPVHITGSRVTGVMARAGCAAAEQLAQVWMPAYASACQTCDTQTTVSAFGAWCAAVEAQACTTLDGHVTGEGPSGRAPMPANANTGEHPADVILTGLAVATSDSLHDDASWAQDASSDGSLPKEALHATSAPAAAHMCRGIETHTQPRLLPAALACRFKTLAQERQSALAASLRTGWASASSTPDEVLAAQQHHMDRSAMERMAAAGCVSRQDLQGTEEDEI